MTKAIGLAAHAILAGESFHTGEGEVIDPALVTVDGDRITVASNLDPDIPLRLCIDHNSAYFSAAGPCVGVKCDGVDLQEVVEYNVVEGWADIGMRLANGRLKLTERGKAARSRRVRGDIVPYWRTQPSRQVRRQLQRVGK